MREKAASTMLVAAIVAMGVATLAENVANGVQDTSMTGPRRIERQNRFVGGARQGRTLSPEISSGVMDWEYGGWRPLQTPKGFYRRIARNLFRDDEGRGPNEVDSGSDLEAASSTKSSSFHSLGLEDFLKSSPGCGDCGFHPLIFLNGRGPRKVRSTSSHTELEDAQILDTHREVNVDIRDAVKEKLREKKINIFLKRSRRSSDPNSVPLATSLDTKKDEKLTVNVPAKEQQAAEGDALDEAKKDRITPADEEPHFLSPKGIFSVAKGIAEALATKPQSEQTETSPATPITADTKLEDEEAHFLSPKAIFGIGKGIAEALAKDLPAPTKFQQGPAIEEDKRTSNDEAHFLSPQAIIGVAKGIAGALATKPADQASTASETGSEEPHFLSPKAILSLTHQMTKALVKNLPGKDKVDGALTSQVKVDQPSSASIKNETTGEIRTPAEPLFPDDVHFLSPRAVFGILKGIGEVATKTAQNEKSAAELRPSNEPKSRVRRQIWNPFRRRPAPPKSNAGGPFGFVNQNGPYEAQSSISSFSFAQNLPQSQGFQTNDFQGLQSFVPPPITNFDKVNSHFDSSYANSPSIGQHLLPGTADFGSTSSSPFVPEPVVKGPPPTRPIKRPEQVQPAAPPSTKGSGLPPPHVIDSLLEELRTTGQIPSNLSPETALVLADILSGRKEHNSEPVHHFTSSPVGPTIDTPPAPFVPETPPPQPPAQIKPPKYQREPAPAPNFHQGALTSPPVSFGALPSPPKRHQGIVRDKVVPATSHEVLYHHDHPSPVTEHVTPIANIPHGHDGLHLNAEGFQRPHTVTRLRTRKRKKPVTPAATPSVAKINHAEQAAEHAVEKDHSSIFPQEHVHIHHHHKRKRKRPTAAPIAKIPVPAPEIHLPDPTPEFVVAPETSLHDIHQHQTSLHDGSHFAVHGQHTKLDAKIHLDTKSHGHSGSGESTWNAAWEDDSIEPINPWEEHYL